MAKTHDLKRRIRSIKNTMQVTKAMKMVSAARLRRAQDRILAARPFALTMSKVLASLAARANPEMHPLLVQREIKRVELVLVTSDRGLCGSFNANAIKAATAFLGQYRPETLNVMTVGRRGRDFVRRRKLKITAEWLDVFRNLDFSTAQYEMLCPAILAWMKQRNQLSGLPIKRWPHNVCAANTRWPCAGEKMSPSKSSMY